MSQAAAPGPDAVREYAAHVMGWARSSTVTVTRFERGNRHAVYRVTLHRGSRTDRDVVVRVALRADADDHIQAEREAQVLETVGGVAGPTLHDFHRSGPWFDKPVMCLEFLPGRQLDLGSRSAADVCLLGSLVATVHNQSTHRLAGELWGPSSGLYAYAQHRVQSILAALSWARDPLPEAPQEQLTRAAEWMAQRFDVLTGTTGFVPGEPLRLLHGDIGPGNVVWSPGPRLIDWEYTRLGDPADEIAYTFDQNALTEVQQQAFWTGYRRVIDSRMHADDVVSRTSWWLPVTLLGSALWWAERWVRRSELDRAGESDPALSQEPAYYLEHITARVHRLQGILDQLG